MRSTRTFFLAAVIAALAGCSMVSGGGAGTRREPPPQPPVEFVNRVWRVVESPAVAPGTLYVFLSDNTLLITPPSASAPLLGRWHTAGGGLVLIEEGFRFPTDIVELGEERFVIRVHRGGAAIDIAMVPARDL